jgi:hypothetical protein
MNNSTHLKTYIFKIRNLFVPGVSREKAVRNAHEECEKRGWPWREPIIVSWHFGAYQVRTSADTLGGNCDVRVSMKDGHIISAVFHPY